MGKRLERKRSVAGAAGRRLGIASCLAAMLAWSWTGASAGEDESREAFRIAVGLVVLEAESPRDGFGQSEFYVSVARRDPAAKQQHEQAKEELKALERETGELARSVAQREAQDSEGLSSSEKEERQDWLASARQRLEDFRNRKASLESTLATLWKRLWGRTSEVSVSGTRVHFADAKLPVKVYPGDTVTVSLWEADAFDSDLMGRKTFAIDRAKLTAGGFELSTGWVEALHLELVPAE